MYSSMAPGLIAEKKNRSWSIHATRYLAIWLPAIKRGHSCARLTVPAAINAYLQSGGGKAAK